MILYKESKPPPSGFGLITIHIKKFPKCHYTK